MRSDARKNYDHLLSIAREAVAERGADASLRDIARRAGVGLATLYRHFPTREALLEALLRSTLDELAQKAADLQSSKTSDEALTLWLRDAVAFVQGYHGVVAVMAAALEDADSALHASCTNLRSAGENLLIQAQADGKARADLDGIDLFALIGALGWVGDQPAFNSRVDRIMRVVADALLASK
ncbi:TetR/AcrR family transcriptional regulator [Novosphingobium sp.]|jgi:AcrR family transcriptional regulator|uniref:TetR/AcrR family transcriptional regulator n=1 Tax=Novosphingobium sp. TaxID=1874826 RepID=UPI002FDDA985